MTSRKSTDLTVRRAAVSIESAGLLEFLLELLLAHPSEKVPDLNAIWGGLLDGKAKSLASRIAKLSAT